jgi:hypothetical protein
MDETVLLDPTSERHPDTRQPAPPLPAADGAAIGLVDIAKYRGDVFLQRLGELLRERDIVVEHFRKPTHAKVAPPELRRRATERCDAVVVGLAD